MRLLRLWFLLATAYLGGRLLSSYWISGIVQPDARFWAHAALVPLLQTAALAPFLIRRGRRPPATVEPPPPIC